MKANARHLSVDPTQLGRLKKNFDIRSDYGTFYGLEVNAMNITNDILKLLSQGEADIRSGQTKSQESVFSEIEAGHPYRPLF